MNWTILLQRTSLLLGVISIILAIWAGTHAQHLLDYGGGRHSGETVVAVILALLFFAGSWYGAKQNNG